MIWLFWINDDIQIICSNTISGHIYSYRPISKQGHRGHSCDVWTDKNFTNPEWIKAFSKDEWIYGQTDIFPCPLSIPRKKQNSCVLWLRSLFHFPNSTSNEISIFLFSVLYPFLFEWTDSILRHNFLGFSLDCCSTHSVYPWTWSCFCNVFPNTRDLLASSFVFIDPFVTSALNGSSIINRSNQGGKERLDYETEEGSVIEESRQRGRLRRGQFPVCHRDSAVLPAEETD